jgi:hypothetical protein
MRSFAKFSQGLLAAGMLAGSLLSMSGCGPDYAIYKVDVTSAKSPRNDIEECRMTITDENDKVVLENYLLMAVSGPPDSSGGPTLIQGCSGGITNARIGTFSYSSSRTSGALIFQVDAYNSPANGSQVVQTGKSGKMAPSPYPPEVGVTVLIQ